MKIYLLLEDDIYAGECGDEQCFSSHWCNFRAFSSEKAARNAIKEACKDGFKKKDNFEIEEIEVEA